MKNEELQEMVEIFKKISILSYFSTKIPIFTKKTVINCYLKINLRKTPILITDEWDIKKAKTCQTSL